MPINTLGAARALLPKSAGALLPLLLSTAALAAPPVEDFAAMPAVRAVEVSPSGDRFFALMRLDGAKEYQFIVFDRTDGLKPIFLTDQTEQARIRRPVWIRDDRIVFSIGMAAQRYGADTTETRLMSLDPDTNEIIPLFRTRADEVPPQIQDNYVSLDEDDPTRVLVQYPTRKGVGVYAVRVDETKNHETVQRASSGIGHWYADEAGEVRAGIGYRDGQADRLMLRQPDGRWTDRPARIGAGKPTFRILGFPADRRLAYVASNHETETDALYEYDVVDDRFTRQLFAPDGVDVGGVVQASGTGEAIGATYAGEGYETHWLTEAGGSLPQRVLAQAESALKGRSVTLTSLNQTDEHAVLYAEEPGAPGAYFLFDTKRKSMLALPPQYPQLEGVPMGRQVAVTYEARDGLDIPAFVTLPPGTDDLAEAQGLPFVVLPHGGPAARTLSGFDWEAQFLASRGYGVLQMNFRGSSGYGQAFRDAGRREWGEAMQQDVEDGARWLVAQGHADEGKLAIMGGSYGGYASLMGAVKTPDLYRCAVAYAPVTDLPEVVRDMQRYTSGGYWQREIGHAFQDRGRLVENSPARRADAIKVPVLLIHGEDDRVVALEQSERMVRAMKKAGTQHRFVMLPRGSHHLDVGDNRLTYLREVEDFLGDCLD